MTDSRCSLKCLLIRAVSNVATPTEDDVTAHDALLFNKERAFAKTKESPARDRPEEKWGVRQSCIANRERQREHRRFNAYDPRGEDDAGSTQGRARLTSNEHRLDRLCLEHDTAWGPHCSDSAKVADDVRADGRDRFHFLPGEALR